MISKTLAEAMKRRPDSTTRKRRKREPFGIFPRKKKRLEMVEERKEGRKEECIMQ